MQQRPQRRAPSWPNSYSPVLEIEQRSVVCIEQLLQHNLALYNGERGYYSDLEPFRDLEEADGWVHGREFLCPFDY